MCDTVGLLCRRVHRRRFERDELRLVRARLYRRAGLQRWSLLDDVLVRADGLHRQLRRSDDQRDQLRRVQQFV
jgi:hypothetical protein